MLSLLPSKLLSFCTAAACLAIGALGCDAPAAAPNRETAALIDQLRSHRHLERRKAALALQERDDEAARSALASFTTEYRDQAEDFFERGSYQKALMAYTTISLIAELSADDEYRLAQSLEKNSELETAVLHYQKAIELRPSYEEARNNLGVAYLSLGRYREALQEFEALLKDLPESARTYVNLSYAYCRNRMLEQAIGAGQKALELEPDNAAAHDNLAFYLLEAGKLDDALAHSKEAVRLERGFANAYHNMALVLEQMGDYRESLARLRQAQHLDTRKTLRDIDVDMERLERRTALMDAEPKQAQAIETPTDQYCRRTKTTAAGD